MPSEDSHIHVANSNQATLRLLLSDFDAHLPWIGTVAFYKALHIVEAVLATKFQRHETTHHSRNRFIAGENSLTKICKHFYPLYTMSQKARYLSDCTELNGVVRFANHISTKTMTDFYLLHHLHQLEKSAASFLNSTILAPITDLNDILKPATPTS